MADAVEPWIVRTQQTLGTLVEKPTMSVKFLSKPPFRFIFDVVAAVAAKTGFGKGLREVCPTDKDEKLQFIIQVIALVGIALDDVLDVNPIKVLRGAPKIPTEIVQFQSIPSNCGKTPSFSSTLSNIRHSCGKKEESWRTE